MDVETTDSKMKIGAIRLKLNLMGKLNNDVGSSKLSSLFGKGKKQEGKKPDVDDSIDLNLDKPLKGPKIVKTTTKQLMVKDKEGITENIEEKIEDLASGKIQVSTQVNKVIMNK